MKALIEKVIGVDIDMVDGVEVATPITEDVEVDVLEAKADGTITAVDAKGNRYERVVAGLGPSRWREVGELASTDRTIIRLRITAALGSPNPKVHLRAKVLREVLNGRSGRRRQLAADIMASADANGISTTEALDLLTTLAIAERL